MHFKPKTALKVAVATVGVIAFFSFHSCASGKTIQKEKQKTTQSAPISQDTIKKPAQEKPQKKDSVMKKVFLFSYGGEKGEEPILEPEKMKKLLLDNIPGLNPNFEMYEPRGSNVSFGPIGVEDLNNLYGQNFPEQYYKMMNKILTPWDLVEMFNGIKIELFSTGVGKITIESVAAKRDDGTKFIGINIYIYKLSPP